MLLAEPSGWNDTAKLRSSLTRPDSVPEDDPLNVPVYSPTHSVNTAEPPQAATPAAPRASPTPIFQPLPMRTSSNAQHSAERAACPAARTPAAHAVANRSGRGHARVPSTRFGGRSAFSLAWRARALVAVFPFAATACKSDRGAAWAEASAPQVRVNQVGYLPRAPKVATVRTDAAAALAFSVEDATGAAVFSGKTRPFGADPASGDRVHFADFSEFARAGSGYLVRVGESARGTLESFPFDVRDDLYEKLKYEALAYFYHNRSGIPITMPFAGDGQWERPAGHLSDRSVPCWRDCRYALDVSGGWYDAGDHGKYVVNGGISAWTLLNLFERTKHLGTSSADFDDGTMNIPERDNGVPDLLDEARYEVEFLLKMQVPEGQPFAGMAHHKIHDHSWSALGREPPAYAGNRALHPPSTAATLNLAAVAAQAGRIFARIDPEFSRRCLSAGLRAWAAAREHPDRFAPERDNSGGGPYDDDVVDDEFYWAAAELFISLEDPVLRDYAVNTPFFRRFPTELDKEEISASMTWQSTAALGSISLAVVPSALEEEGVDAVRRSIVAAADRYLAIIGKQGYRVPIAMSDSGKYPWGSNSFILNNAIVLALAYDFTRQDRYAGGVSEAVDYLFGRNPLVQSYVTGYGEIPLEKPHHRFWAESYRNEFPPPPPGVVSGGPNSSLQDPQSRKAGLSGCEPQKCFVDHIEAWAVNEITINWNAPFAWVLAFLDEHGRSERP